MAVQTLNSRTLKNVVVAVTSDNVSANRPHRYTQNEIMAMPSTSDGSLAPRPGPDIPAANVWPPIATWTTLAAWTAANEAADVAIDTAAVSWAR
jgi:hypothetical protein